MITTVVELKVITVTERITEPLRVGSLFWFRDGIKLVTKIVTNRDDNGIPRQRVYVDNFEAPEYATDVVIGRHPEFAEKPTERLN